ncbi:MAG: glycine betaine ABC transporter substrate-binding protein [bacterium]
MSRITKKAVIVVIGGVLLVCLYNAVMCCIGRVITIGITNQPDQKIMSEILSCLIGESTGTSIEIIDFKDHEKCIEAALNGEINIYIDYYSDGLRKIEYKNPEVNPRRIYSIVKQGYKKEFDLVWLKPFGYIMPSDRGQEFPNMAAAVVRKDTLNKFPLLGRLINKLNNKILNESLEELLKKATNGINKDMAFQFLKNNNLLPEWKIS